MFERRASEVDGMPQVNESVSLWTSESGRPERLVWRSRRYRITDTPTALVGPCDWWRPFSSAAFPEPARSQEPLAITGWRFQARADDGETHVFDVQSDDDGSHWELIRFFD